MASSTTISSGGSVGQGAQRRSIEQTLDLAWVLLERFPTNELKRISAEILARYRRVSA